MRRLEDHARRLARLPGLDPAQDMQAPPVALLEAAKTHLRPGRDEVIAPGDAELQELVRHLDADQVRDPVLVVRRAAAVAEVAGERRVAAGPQLPAEDVLLSFHGRSGASAAPRPARSPALAAAAAPDRQTLPAARARAPAPRASSRRT